jgi:Response regulator receiver domain
MATILVIDDQEPIRKLLRTVLEGAGHEVTEARNGRLGLAAYRERPADLVITDIVMPEMNGLDMILELTRAFLNVKVIAISGGMTQRLSYTRQSSWEPGTHYTNRLAWTRQSGDSRLRSFEDRDVSLAELYRHRIAGFKRRDDLCGLSRDRNCDGATPPLNGKGQLAPGFWKMGLDHQPVVLQSYSAHAEDRGLPQSSERGYMHAACRIAHIVGKIDRGRFPKIAEGKVHVAQTSADQGVKCRAQ